jgi:hypothetical protein
MPSPTNLRILLESPLSSVCRMIAFPWIPAGFLALSIRLALVARKPREVDTSRWPIQAQQSGTAGIIVTLAFLVGFTAQVSWWSPVPVIGAGVTLWILASLLPRFVRLALEVVSIVGWP